MTTAHARIGLKAGGYTRACQVKGWTSTRQAAEAIGVAHTTLGRVLRGDSDPGEQLMAGLMAATGWPFAELFELHQPATA